MDNEMLADFKAEAAELYDEAEENLLAIEKTDDYLTCFNAIFTAFHSITGAAEMFGLDRLQQHMCYTENLLEKKKSRPNMSGIMINYLLNAIEVARKILNGDEVEFDYYDPDESFKHTAKVNTNSKFREPLKDRDAKRSQENDSDGVVIVVDDEPDICELIRDFLELREYVVYTFTDPHEALKKVKDLAPDLIITDINMPGINGIELMNQVDKIIPNIPVIVVSGFITKEACLDAFTCGVAGILEKPFDDEQLLAMASVLITRSRKLKLVDKSIDLLVNQFEDFDQFLGKKFGNNKRDLFRADLKKILIQRKILMKGNK